MPARKNCRIIRTLALLCLGFGFVWSRPLFAQVHEAWMSSYPTNDFAAGQAYALAVDGSGNVFITGYDTVKYDANGHQLWNTNGGVALGLDAKGNVCIADTVRATNGESELVTTKYDADGNLLWRSQYRGPANLSDYVKAIAVDSAGNVCVTGTIDCDNPPCFQGITYSDFATIRYSSNTTATLFRLRCFLS